VLHLHSSCLQNHSALFLLSVKDPEPEQKSEKNNGTQQTSPKIRVLGWCGPDAALVSWKRYATLARRQDEPWGQMQLAT
jgi:hypothetical protein